MALRWVFNARDKSTWAESQSRRATPSRGRQNDARTPGTGTGDQADRKQLLMGEATDVKVLGKLYEKGFSESRNSTSTAILRAHPRQVSTGGTTGE